jgi:hypothetical protein
MVKFFSKLIAVWMVIEVALPLFTILAFSMNEVGLVEIVCAKNSMIYLLNFGSCVPKIRFYGIKNIYLSEVIGSIAWFMGVISIPIFIIPIILRAITGGRKLAIDVRKGRAFSNLNRNQRVNFYLLILFLIGCGCYYVFLGYVSSYPIHLKSAMGAAAMVLGISFGPAGIILLSCVLAIDVMASSFKQGVSDE